MMTSYPEHMPVIARAIAELAPRRVLDIGTGFGKYALIAKEAVASLDAEAGEWHPRPILVDCCECADYFHRLPWHQALYDGHFHGPAAAMEPERFADYDLVLAIDVAEHMPKPDWHALVERIKAHRDVPVLVSTPKAVVMYAQRFYGDDCPRHVTQFEDCDFHSPKRNYSTPLSWIFLL